MPKRPKSVKRGFTYVAAQEYGSPALTVADYKRRYAEIQSLVTFKFPKRLTVENQRKLARYYGEYDRLNTRVNKVVRPRSRKKLEMALTLGRHDPNLKEWKAALIPVSDPTAKITFKRNSIAIRDKFVTTEILLFDQEKLARSPRRHVKSTIAQEKNAQRFTVIAGKFEIHQSYSRDTIADYVAQLMKRYGDESKNNYWENWLLGLNAYTFHNQAKPGAYFAAKAKRAKAQRKANKTKRDSLRNKSRIESRRVKRG